MKIHLIAIGGAVMHNMALALKDQGHKVSGSDDEIFDPAKNRLKKAGLLPIKMGWDENNISTDLDFVILGMHARKDNPELLKAQHLGLKIESFPGFAYQQTKDKIRMVVAGSHGKTTTTAMIMHVFKILNMDYDYLVGSQVKGYERMVQFSNAPISIIEGDEYLSSPLDMKPKFLHYIPQLAMITGIAWDHINVFPTFEGYVQQFELFLKSMPIQASLIYNAEDKTLQALIDNYNNNNFLNLIPYHTLAYSNSKNGIDIFFDNQQYKMPWFGKHNVSNMSGAMQLCAQYKISTTAFISAMQTFDGTAKRLEKMFDKDGLTIIRDFAHSPSKLKATVEAVKEQYPHQKVYAFFELHTFSSLQENFLPQYVDCMAAADESYVYLDNDVFLHKKLPLLSEAVIFKGFKSKVQLIPDLDALTIALKLVIAKKGIVLLMSSGNFGGIQVNELL